jgi:hypothetical protein
MAKATLIARDRLKFANGFISEFVIWELPDKTADRPHGYKYRLYFGDSDGNCLVRYDNESGKGDHKHIGNKELPYQFVDIDTLFNDFEHDSQKALRKWEKKQ